MGRGLLNGRTAIVTGAGQGLGQAIAREYADEGAALVLLERNPVTLNATADELRSKGALVLPIALDLTDYDAYRKAISEAADQLGHLDILVNNAAIAFYGTILEDSLEEWRAQITVNLEAIYMGTKIVAPYMVKQQFGRVINITSI